METRILIVEDNLAGIRCDRVIAEMIPEITRSFAQKLADNGSVSVNDIVLSKNNCKLKAGDKITVKLPDPEPLAIEPENIPLDIIYEDDDICIVNKPKGMVVHPAPGHSNGTLVNALLYHCGGHLSGINGIARPGIVHRIDRDTTGLLVVCKNDTAHLSLSEQLAVHSITRVYDCICEGILKEDGTIDANIGRSTKDRKKMCVTAQGRRAVTHYFVQEPLAGKYTYVKCRLETGRTHQIRVHMASIHHPLLGDTVYGREKQPFSTDGQVLHAGVLGFVHPRRGEYMEFQAPLPEYFEKLLNKLRMI
ncbi:MAG: RluA family pseudouridine synthase [Lachnospiraceae bacterium]|nr:RluA family pseudouridine synthase [Lachnospiraceae bacterium]